MKKVRFDTLIFVIFITVFGIANLVNPNKSEISLQENRALAKKPVFTIQSVLDKSYAKGWNDYYSDTVFFRENLIQANVDIKKNFGLGKDQISIVIVGNETAPTKTPKPSHSPQNSPSPVPTETQEENPEQTGQPMPSSSPSSTPSQEEPTG